MKEATNAYEEKLEQKNNIISKVCKHDRRVFSRECVTPTLTMDGTFWFQMKKKLINEKDVHKTLVTDTENDVDDNVLREQHEFRRQLRELKDLYTKSMSELVEHEMKYNSYAFRNRKKKKH